MKIIILGHDWRNIALNNPNELIRRLNRDVLDTNLNKIHLMLVSKSRGERVISKNVTSEYVYFPFEHLRPFSDIFLGIILLKKIKQLSPDLVVASESSLFWWIIFLTNRPRTCIYKYIEPRFSP